MAATAVQDVARKDRFEYVIRLADDSLILSHRVAEWASWAPQLEEDMALVNIGLDLLGQARLLLTYAGEIEGEGNTEDDLAFLREEHEFRSLLLVEQPTVHHFDQLIAQLFYYSAYALPLWERLVDSADSRLAEIAAKSVKEARYHLEHAAGWVIRLGDGTAESHARIQDAVDALWPLAGDFAEVDPVVEEMASHGLAPHPEALMSAWDATVTEVFAEATLTKPERGFRQGTGRQGLHSEHLGYLLAEMQYIHRLHPGAQW
ncbi:1,2-phenylacetyl-CoA epoxidase subunit PaaC [Janibacter sp. GXQ6167]|uniref:1,2-phenylacetyl-CoA epoxidase subunit PaaC n=1 Tax=Janibacter sp. GXQ6167 TaxID=3240791 RepID=UPI0035267F62